MINSINVEMATIPENVGLARIIAAGFIAPLDPTVEEISDIKTAVSEAVTNAIIHGYCGSAGGTSLCCESKVSPLQPPPMVKMKLAHNEARKLVIEIIDSGIGIEDIDAVREPMFTTKPDLERSGLGFTVMETFMDSVEVKSSPGVGTTVILTKTLKEAPVL